MSAVSKRHSLSPPATPHDLKTRVISSLNKLADRDTFAIATSELEAMARGLTQDSYSPFLSCIYNTDSTSKSPVRRQCVHLLTVMSNSHGDSLSPFLSKMISTVLRRIRDPDSAVRSACVDAISAMSSHITRPPFSAFLKPLMETLTLEQDLNSQIGSALCLAAAIESVPEPEVEVLRKTTLPRLGKLAKNEGFKAKAALFVLIGSVVDVGGASSLGVLEWLVPCLVEFLSNEDWTIRKAAAEALGKVASVEKDLASEYKGSCLNSLEDRRFDKIKVVRETMNRTLEMWKEVPGASDEVSPPAKSHPSLIGSQNGKGRNVTKSSAVVSSKSPQLKKTITMNGSPPSAAFCASTMKKNSPIKSNDKESSAGLSHKPNHKKLSNCKDELAFSRSSSFTIATEDDIKRSEFGVLESVMNEDSENSRLQVNRVLFNKMPDEKGQKLGNSISGPRVVPLCVAESHVSDVVDKNVTEENFDNSQDVENLSIIREKLLQIENQQSSLLDLLQKFIGSSHSGMNNLETRVHGLEMALEEMSCGLAVSSGKIPTADSTEDACCKLPGADFLTSRFWRKTEGRYPSSKLSSATMPSLNVMLKPNNTDARIETRPLNSKRFHLHRDGLVANPQADVCNDLKGHLLHHSNRTVQDANRAQGCRGVGLDGVSPACRTTPMYSTGRPSMN